MTHAIKTTVPRSFTAALVALAGFLVPCLNAQDAPLIVPTPKVLKVSGGEMAITAKTNIVATDKSLQPLAAIFADEIATLTGLKVNVSTAAPQLGDIVLKINPALKAGEDILAAQKQGAKPVVAPTKNFAHTITVANSALVEGWDYRAVCEGTATLLQAISAKGGNVSLPKMTVQDWPHADYTGTMVDVARQRIPVDTLKAVVEACRLWKVRYCQLHLTDDEGFTFPSAAFPKLGTKNTAMHEGIVPVVYGLQELKDLVAYADARGVTLVPELATPNHADAMCRAMPEVFAGPKIMNVINDGMYKSLDTLVGEMCDVFKSSPYFHIGGEEPYFYELEESAAGKAYMAAKGMKSISDVIVQHQARMIDMVSKHGKMTLAWENGTVFDASQKDGMVIMSWVPYPMSEENKKMGFAIISVPWERGPELQKWNMFECNGTVRTAQDRVLGGATTMWQMSASAVVSDFLGGKLNGSSTEGYILSIGDHMDGAWSPTVKTDPAESTKKLAATRAILQTLLFPVRITAAPVGYRAWPVTGNYTFNGKTEVKIALADGIPAGEIHFTTDGLEPTEKSPVYSAPVSLEDTAVVHAALFRNGKQVGAVSRVGYKRLDGGKTAKAK